MATALPERALGALLGLALTLPAQAAWDEAAWREVLEAVGRLHERPPPPQALDESCRRPTAPPAPANAAHSLADCMAGLLPLLGEGARWLTAQDAGALPPPKPPRAELLQGRLWLQLPNLPAAPHWALGDQAWDRALRELPPEAAASVLLDLRGNGGGLVDGVLQAAWLFLPGGRPALRSEDRQGSTPHSLPADGQVTASATLWAWRERLQGLPLTIWVDAGTAIGAEALALLLREGRGARLIGRPSAGRDGLRAMQWLRRSNSLLILPSGRLRLADGRGWSGGLPLDQDWSADQPPPLSAPATTR